MKDNPTVTVLVLVETGSKYEIKEKNGISHFLEHVCFKGTEKRKTAKDIMVELDGLGCQNNAFTNQEFTGYYAKGKATNFNKMLDVISDVYLNPTLKEQELEREKGVIIDEINLNEDMPAQKAQMLFINLVYGDQPAGWPIRGEKEIIRSISREDFLEYRKKHYVAEATTVVISGNVDTKEAFREVENKFKSISTDKKVGKKKTKDSQNGPMVGLGFKETDQTHVVMGVRSFSLNDKRTPTVEVLASLLGGSMSSRLFQKVREEMGVGYYVGSGNNTTTDTGCFTISCGVANNRAIEVVSAIIKELETLKTQLVSEEELKKVKEYMVGTMYQSLESSLDLAWYYGLESIFRNKILLPKDQEKLIRSVTAEEIRKIARKIFVEKNLNLAIVGPFKDEEKFKALLKIK